jgi:hypothetical protein
MSFIDDKIIDITSDVKWIGVLDYDIRTFDIVMHTEYGTTYNSYFINAEKKAVIELAKEKFSTTYLDKLKRVTDPSEIQYIILDHTEPDHSGSLRLLLELAPSAIVVGSGNAIRYLEDIVNKPFKSEIRHYHSLLPLTFTGPIRFTHFSKRIRYSLHATHSGLTTVQKICSANSMRLTPAPLNSTLILSLNLSAGL